MALAVLAGHAGAAQLLNNDDYSVRLDTNVAYTLGVRTAKPSDNFANPAAVPGAAFVNDGDGAFKQGDLVFNRVDLSLEFDAMMKDRYKTGLRVSGLAFYDQVYHAPHEPIPQASYNATSVGNTAFTRTARRLAGEDVQLFDLFVHSGFDLGEHAVTFRLGRHTLLWGESLFLSTNGVASGQAPINANKALSVPLIQAKEVFLPVNQLSATVGLNEQWSLQGYYQFEYRETTVSPPGTYFSTADFVFQGAETFAGLPRGSDLRPPNARGQWGLAAKFSGAEVGWDAGLYYLRYDDKTPQLYADFANGNFRFVYPRNIELVGASASTTVGDANVAGEVNYRRNIPLFGTNGFTIAPPTGITAAMSDADALHPVGESVHAQVSTIWVLPTVPWWDTAAFLAEFGAHRVTKITKNAASIDATRGRSMAGFAMSLTPTYYQLVGGADISFPVSFAYNLTPRRSLVDGPFNGGTGGHGGKAGLGVNVKYTDAWRGGLTYTHYIGSDTRNGVTSNQYGDRDFLAFNVNYSF